MADEGLFFFTQFMDVTRFCEQGVGFRCFLFWGQQELANSWVRSTWHIMSKIWIDMTLASHYCEVVVLKKH